MKYLTVNSLEEKDFPSGLGGGDRECLGEMKVLMFLGNPQKEKG
jgi:hypothetical protein